MKFTIKKTGLLFTLLLSSCNGSSSSSTSSGGGSTVGSVGYTNGTTLAAVSGPNVLPLTVNGSTCTSASNINQPCVEITVCTPGSTTACVTINNILLDTQSYGLRIFASALTGVTPTPITKTIGSTTYTESECAHFGSANTWGPVEMLSVVLGQESPITIPVQVIAPTPFNPAPMPDPSNVTDMNNCTSPVTSAASIGFNGIMGIGTLIYDYPEALAGSAQEDDYLYFACPSNTATVCNPSNLSTLAHAVVNPVSQLSQDNNGLIVMLPQVSSSGAVSASGYVVLGIGTQTNNQVKGVDAYTVDSNSDFQATFQGQVLTGFIDSGSNAMYISNPPSTTPDCSGATWLCPNSILDFLVTFTSASGSQTGTVTVPIADTLTLLNSNNSVFPNLAGDGQQDGAFDYGLPFFLGRNVYVQFQNKTSSLGTGPLWGF